MLLEFNYIAEKHNAEVLAYQLRCNGVKISAEELLSKIEIVDIDHDSGDFVADGGDYVKVLDFMECQGLAYPVRIHSQNPVGVQKMRAIIQHNGWQEVR